jgi:predicted flap endonuclease-1-like 5' DNA nuclease
VEFLIIGKTTVNIKSQRGGEKMKTHDFPAQAVRKLFMVLLIAILAFQAFGMNGLAAPAAVAGSLQENKPPTLKCGCPETSIQTVFMIDDSGSMRSNDPTNERKKLAKDFINLLASLQETPGSGVQNVKVAVIHFTGDVQTNSGDAHVDITPKFQDLKASTTGTLFDSIDWKPKYDRPETTNFLPPFAETKKLFADPKVAQTECARKSIVLLTDGTPEDLQGIITDKTKLAALKDNIEKTAKGQLDRLVIIGYSANGKYFTTDMTTYWDNVINNISGSKDGPPVVLLSPDQAKELIAKAQAAIETAQNQNTNKLPADVKAKIDEVKAYLAKKVDTTPPADLQIYQTMNLSPDPGTLTVKPGVENIIKFQLLDNSSKPVVPGKIGSYTLEINPSITQGTLEQKIKQAGPVGDGYQVSWNPEIPDPSLLKVVAKFTNANGQDVMDCWTNVPLGWTTPTGQTIVLTLVVGSPQLPVVDGSVTLPLNLDYKGNKAPVTSLDWHPTASDLDDPNQKLTAEVIPPGNKTPGNYALKVSGLGPITKVRHIQAQVSADSVIDGQPISANPAATKFEIPYTGAGECTYGTSGWANWFWPLAILLAAMLIFLLAIGFWRRQDDTRRGWQFKLRRGDWHFLFWPLLALFIFLILVPVFSWYCIIPPWIFLASLLVWLVMLVLVSFTPENNSTRTRPWWLAILLAVLIPVFYFLFPDLWPALIVLELLALAWLIYWWRPLPPLLGVSLSLGSPKLPPVDDSLRLPVKLTLKGNQEAPSSLRWNISVQSSSPLAAWRIIPDTADGNEYELILEGIGEARTIEVELSADVEVDNQALTTPPASATIEIVPAFPPYLILGSSNPSYVHLQESVSLPLQLIYAGDRAWTSSLEWEPSVNDIRGGATVKPVNAESGEYELVIDPVAAGEKVEVAVGAKAVLNGRSIEIPSQSAALQIIHLPVPIIIEHLLPVIISLAVPLDCVPKGKEINLPVHLDIKEPTKVSSFHWTPPPANAIPGGDVTTSIVPVDEAAGEYLLKIDPVSGAREIQVQACAEAVIDGKPVEITSKVITIKICTPPGPPDDLTKIEGIGPVIASIFNRNGIYTFEELAQANIEEIEPLLKGQRLSNITNPKTWPQQAEVAARAKVSGDWSEFDDYISYLKAGLPPEEWDWNRYKNSKSHKKP